MDNSSNDTQEIDFSDDAQLRARWGGLPTDLVSLMGKSLELDEKLRNSKTEVSRRYFTKKLVKNNNLVFRKARLYNLLRKTEDNVVANANLEAITPVAVADNPLSVLGEQ